MNNKEKNISSIKNLLVVDDDQRIRDLLKEYLVKEGFLITTADCAENACLLYTSPSPRDQRGSRMPSSA